MRWKAEALARANIVACATGHHFYLLNDGNAVNFVHGAAVGPFIYLVQGEILAALSLLTSGRLAEPGLHQVAHRVRESIARAWLRTFDKE